jgi:hypothetical protein
MTWPCIQLVDEKRCRRVPRCHCEGRNITASCIFVLLTTRAQETVRQVGEIGASNRCGCNPYTRTSPVKAPLMLLVYFIYPECCIPQPKSCNIDPSLDIFYPCADLLANLYVVCAAKRDSSTSVSVAR